MERERKLMTKKILDLTLEIIYLLSGEEYTVVKKISGDHVTSGKRSCVLGGWNRRQSPLMDSINNSRLPQRHNDKRILEVTNMIIELLTGEVLTVCQDVTLSLSMEEGETIEEHKDPYKDAVMEDHPPLSLDGSRNPPERCHSPLYPKHPTLEGHKISNNKQADCLFNVKAEVSEKKEKHLGIDMKCMEMDIPKNGPSNENSLRRFPSPLFSQNTAQELHKTSHEVQVKGQSLINVKAEVPKKEQQTCSRHDVCSKVVEAHAIGSSNRSPLDRCPSPYSRESTQGQHTVLNAYQGERQINMKNEATGREDGMFLWTNMQCKGKKAIASRPTNKNTQDRGTSTSSCQDSSQEHHQIPHYYQAQNLINIKVEKTESEEDKCLWTDGKCKQKNLPKGGPSNKSPSEKCPSSLYNPDSIQKHQEVPHHYQEEDLIEYKSKDVESSKQMCEMQCKEEEIPAEIGADGRYMRYNTEKCSVINEDGRAEDIDLQAGSSEEAPISANVQPAAQWTDASADPSAHVVPVPDPPPPVTHTYRRRGETFLCPDCGECFTQRAKLFRHQKTHTVEMPYTCLECGKCFAEKVHLVNHERCHKVEKPYACSFCGKCFGEKGNLSNHERSHRKEKMFFCYDCGKCFTQRGHFNRHQRIHTGEKPYSCPECGKCFSQSEYLVRHQRCHSGEKPFTCPECGKCFTDKYDLAKHERIHGTNRPFYCSVCGKGFNQKSNLSRHERVHTQIIAVSME
ncbi:oocyte zinc finger protein XlCOF7.1-like isoform X4 [Hyperolius riggenbachi]|uniref:oocyte zinc finger protein XlCOF7.1-like isoform X4 n=1 Tax=Hyperolius riggenbachi TaxID=752182 RepID=UPI0035A38D55